MGGDYYNLGILGAKARDAEAQQQQAQPGMRQGGGRGGMGGGESGDVGPSRLEVVVLFPDGPAQKAGLRIGDVIIGIGKRAFKEGSLGPIADALVKAESGGGKGILTLLIERGGENEKLEVKLPQPGKHYAKPLQGKAREEIFLAACKWLADKQQGGGFPQTLSGQNGAVVQTAVAGLAWLCAGSDTKRGKFKQNVKDATEFVLQHAGKEMSFPGMGGQMPGGRGGSMNQTNWGSAHAAIFLGEVHGRAPARALKAGLLALGADLVERQEESGGWAHGPGGPNPLGYVELNIVTGLALCGLGMAHQAGYEVPEDCLQRAEAFLEASSSGDGGVGYADKPGQKGMGNIGRTASCWLGYQLLGLGKSGWGVKMRKWTERHIDEVMGGHASLMQHIFHAGLAAGSLGKGAHKSYWKQMRRDFTLARAPDGSFQPRPWHESLSLGSNSDVSFGQVWTTATWAIVLACDGGGNLEGVPLLMGR
jgi:hypothetical protein